MTRSPEHLFPPNPDPSSNPNHSPEHLFPLNTTFEAFGVGIYTYVKVVRRAADFFVVLFLMSMSNMVSNFYGGALDREVASPNRTGAWMQLWCRWRSAVEAP